MANQIEIEVIARLDDIEKSLKKLQNDAQKAGENVGKSLGSNLEKSISSSFKSIAATVAAAGAAILSGAAFKKVIDEATKSENAINRLNQSLRSAGTFSEEASLRIQDFAEQIQNTTTLEDEAVLSGVALAQNFTKTSEAAQNLTEAAIDLAAATGVSLDTAVENLGKSLSGTAGRMTQSVPEIKKFTEEQLKAGAAIDFVAKRFAGAGAAELNTFSGALKRLNNLTGNLLEEFGKFVIKSPAIREAFKFVSESIIKVTKEITKMRGEGGDQFKQFLIDAINISKFFTTILGPAIEFIFGLINKVGVAIGGLAGVFQALAHPGSRSAITIGQVFDELAIKSDAFKLKTTEAIKQYLTDLEEAVRRSQEAGKKLGKNSEDAAIEVSNNFKEMAGVISGPVNSLIVAGVSSIGAALVKGGSAFGDFAKTALNILGDFAIQLGIFIVAADTAVIKLKASLLSFFGGAGIVAGLALIAIGGALKAFAAGPSGGGATAPTSSSIGGGVSGGTSAPIGESAASFEPQERQAPSTSISVNIAGNVLGDKRTLGKEIADSLNEAFGFDGIVLARGAIS